MTTLDYVKLKSEFLLKQMKELVGEIKALEQKFIDKADDEMLLIESEKYRIERALTICNGNQSKVAKMLGVADRTIYRKIEKYGINSDSFKKKFQNIKI